MPDQPGILVLCTDHATRDAVTATLADLGTVTAAASAAQARAEAENRNPDLVIAAPPLPDADTLALLLELTARITPAPTILLLLTTIASHGELRAIPLGLSTPWPLRELTARSLESRAEAGTDEITRLLRAVAHARHEINNPLTSALAETQLLLMEGRDPELRESLELIESQLRRIRDIIATTLRFPRPPR